MLIAGAGMAGLVCAARVRELGLRPSVHERGSRPGGSMLLSSGVVWRHRLFEDFRSECPGGDERLQRLIWERLDDALAWLDSLGAEPVWQDTENPRTTGRRYDPRALTELLAGPVGGDVELETALADGAGLDAARARGAAVTPGLDEFYGRAMPAPPARIREEDFVPLSQLYGRWARVFTDDGRDVTPPSVTWSENDLAQLIGPRAWFVLDAEGLAHAGGRVEAARAAGGTVVDPSELAFETPSGSRVAVHVAAAVTHTIGGIEIDTQTRALDGVLVAGVDAGGIATGGYASGLAQALVLGLVAAEALAR